MLVILCTFVLERATRRAAAYSFDNEPLTTREQRWESDIQIMVSTLYDRHIDFEQVQSESAFAEIIATIHRDLPLISDEEVTLRLFEAIASLKIGHTTIAAPENHFDYFPVRLKWLNGEFIVLKAPKSAKEILGRRVLSFGVLPPAEAERRMKRFIPLDNETALHFYGNGWMTFAPMLERIGATDIEGNLTITVEGDNKKKYSHTFEPRLSYGRS